MLRPELGGIASSCTASDRSQARKRVSIEAQRKKRKRRRVRDGRTAKRDIPSSSLSVGLALLNRKQVIIPSISPDATSSITSGVAYSIRHQKSEPERCRKDINYGVNECAKKHIG